MSEEQKEQNEHRVVHSEVRPHEIKDENREVSHASYSGQKIMKNPWMIASVILSIVVIILLVILFRGDATGGAITGNVVAEDKAASDIQSFVKRVYGIDLVYNGFNETDELYNFDYDYSNRTITLSSTKDVGFIRLPNGNWVRVRDFEDFEIPPETEETSAQQEQKEIPKSDKPKVELFVMSYCPYGTQAEKGIIPALKALGDKIDAKIRFVHYVMHGEKETEENYRDMCIREKYPEKFYNYLGCFLNASDAAGCIKSTGLNEKEIEDCIAKDAEGYYAIDSKLSQGYGVQGSPTLVLNGVQAEFYPRSASNALAVICDAFNTKPDECDLKLSEDNPSPGFGYSSTDEATAASCV